MTLNFFSFESYSIADDENEYKSSQKIIVEVRFRLNVITGGNISVVSNFLNI